MNPYRVSHNFPFTTILSCNLAIYTLVKMMHAITSSLKSLHYQCEKEVMARLQKYHNVTNMAARGCAEHDVQGMRTAARHTPPHALNCYDTHKTPYW